MLLKTGNFQFGDFVLDTEERALSKNGATIPLPPKALKLLEVLIERRGRIVEKDELIEQVWPDTFVEEGNLTYTIRLLRKALGDDAGKPRFIETIPRRGYRFISEERLASKNGRAERPRFGESTFSNGRGRDDEDSLIGRANEVADITDLLARESVRLVTLTGPGGTGKTRLAKEIASQVGSRFTDGVFFIDLTAVNDPMLVGSAIAHELGIRESGAKPTHIILSDHLREKSTLLVLDNFEQVVSAGVGLAGLIREAPDLKLLVTSREPLKLSIEREYRVPPLATPLPDARETLSRLMQFGAVRLFVQRSKTARPDLHLTENDADALSGICQKLDGLPLALELAASRARVLSVQEILSKLENCLSLLTGGSRDKPDRQQTMRATIEWSYGLLNELEKSIFVMLSVFEGGFTFRAAESVLMSAVGDGSTISETDIVDSVTSLTEKGLLLSKKSVDSDLRFRMLVVVRDYALEARSQRTEPATVERSHAEYFRNFVEIAAPHLFSFEYKEWLDRLDPERDNIRAAIRWSLDNDPQLAARILAAVRHLAAMRLHTSETRSWLEDVLKKSRDLPPHLQFEMLAGLGVVCQYQGDLTTARRAHEPGLDISRRLSDKRLIARALRGIAAIDYMQLDIESSREHLDEALAISRSVGDEFGEAAALARLGDLANAERDHSNARLLITEALEIFRRLGYQQGISSKLTNLSITEFADGKYESARQCLIEGLLVSIEIGDEIDFRVNFEIAAALLVESGNYEMAARFSAVAAARCEDMAYCHEPVEQWFRETYLAKLTNAMSKSDFEAAVAEGRKMTASEAAELALDAAKAPERSRKHLHLVRSRGLV